MKATGSPGPAGGERPPERPPAAGRADSGATGRIPGALVDSIDRIHGLVRDSRRLPWTTRLLVDEEALLEVAESLEHAIPDELRRAYRILAEREQILEEARREADRLLEAARRQAAELSSDSAVTREAQSRAQQMVEHAQQVSWEMRRGALRYADDTLSRLEREVAAVLDTIRQHRQELRAHVPAANPANKDAEAP